MPLTRSGTKLASSALLASSDPGAHPEIAKPGDHEDHNSEISENATSVSSAQARKLAAEARVRRRQLDRERRLAEMEKQVEEDELRVELAAIEVVSAASRRSLRSRHSSRLVTWVKDVNSQVNEFASFSDNDAQPEQANPVQPDRVQDGHTAGLPSQADAYPAARLDHVPNVPESTCPHTALDLNNATLSLSNVNGMIKAIADTAAATKALVVGQTRTRKLQHMDLPPFSGHPSQWLQFKRFYDTTKSFYSPIENVIRLQQALHGAAREAVASVLVSTEAPDEVLLRLEQCFARPELIVFHEVAALKNLPNLTLDLKGLATLTSRVRNSVATIRLLKQNEYLHSPELFYCILNKLNHTLRMRWTDYASDSHENKTKLELLSDFLVRELERHVSFGLSPDAIQPTSSSHFPSKPLTSKSSYHSDVPVHTSTPDNCKVKCSYCDKSHNISVCTGFKSLSTDDRWRWLRSKRVCYRCLKGNSHTWNTCKAKPCGVDGCTRRHHALLHGGSDPGLSSRPQIQEVVGLSSSHCTRPRKTLLKVVPVTVSGPAGSYDTYGLLDDGSTATLIDSMVADKIGSTGPSDTIKINAIGGMNKTSTVSYVNFYIKGRYTTETFKINNARAIDSLTLHTQTIEPSDITKFHHLSDLTDMLTYTDAVPTILIGAEDWYLSITREVRKGHRSEPVACLTALGWTLYGSIGRRTKPVTFINHTLCTHLNNEIEQHDSLESLIKEQYKLDSIGITKRDNAYSLNEQRAVDILSATAERSLEGRFTVGLPWRDESVTVPDSYYQAESRLKGLEKRMAKDNVFAESYKNYIADIISKGYAEECAAVTYHTSNISRGIVHTSKSSPRWYLPHFGVYHPQKKKLRVVHDAAAKTCEVSLNTLLLPGPDLLQSLLGILFRFREGRIAMTADIKEMFPQVRIREQDRDALRFLWRSDSNEPIKEFRMTSVIFGACSSPFIAQYIKNRNAQELAHQYPSAADAIVHDHYMDDYIGSLDDASEAARLASDIVIVHKAAGFEMRGWISSDARALSLVPSNLHAAPSPEVHLEAHLHLPTTSIRALGVLWLPKEDCLGFRKGANDELPSQLAGLTKRQALSYLMRVYDPLGLLAPIVVKGRVMFQTLWRSNVGWDEQLSTEIIKTWQDWFNELLSVANIYIPRCYLSVDVVERELHIFADASELAYACVAYWRFVLRDGVFRLALIGSKSRVTPLKPVSIPRLELQAALIASRWAVTITECHRFKPIRFFYWSDSRTVLSWLRADARTFRPFVAHRVGEIVENTNVDDWRWVPTDLNVADDATRFRTVESSSRWFVGPQFLLQPSDMWPTEPTEIIAPVLTELKTHYMCELVGYTRELMPPVTANPSHFSDWTRLVRATARAHQAAVKFRTLLDSHAQNSKSRLDSFISPSPNHSFSVPCHTGSNLPTLTSELIKTAEQHILRQCQLDSFPDEIRCIKASQGIPMSSPLLKLSPALGDDNLLRLAGRIRAAPDIDTDTKSPILLDGRHHITRLLVLSYHKKMAHANSETVVNELRQKYWILRLRPTVKTVAKSCRFCRIRKAPTFIPPTADLPVERLAHHQKPFTHVGLDYFGPLEVTIGRRREKRYVALYTCLTVRAIHFEVVHSLSSDSAIMSLRRFIARRGSPSTIISDNGTAFVGASKELRMFFGNKIEEFAATTGIKWKFIPPAAPFFGGCWERLVRSTKTALRMVLHQKAPKEETFQTLLMEVEAIINSRPLSHVSVDAEDQETLTPFHFLIGCSSPTASPDPALDDYALVGRSEWKKASRLADHFWSRWVREVLPLLHSRSPAPNTPSEVSVGDIVIIADNALPRGVWPKGRVTHVYPGRDGVVRVVDVVTKGGILRRPVKKIAVISP